MIRPRWRPVQPCKRRTWLPVWVLHRAICWRPAWRCSKTVPCFEDWASFQVGLGLASEKLHLLGKPGQLLGRTSTVASKLQLDHQFNTVCALAAQADDLLCVPGCHTTNVVGEVPFPRQRQLIEQGLGQVCIEVIRAAAAWAFVEAVAMNDRTQRLPWDARPSSTSLLDAVDAGVKHGQQLPHKAIAVGLELCLGIRLLPLKCGLEAAQLVINQRSDFISDWGVLSCGGLKKKLDFLNELSQSLHGGEAALINASLFGNLPHEVVNSGNARVTHIVQAVVLAEPTDVPQTHVGAGRGGVHRRLSGEFEHAVQGLATILGTG